MCECVNVFECLSVCVCVCVVADGHVARWTHAQMKLGAPKSNVRVLRGSTIMRAQPREKERSLSRTFVLGYTVHRFGRTPGKRPFLRQPCPCALLGVHCSTIHY